MKKILGIFNIAPFYRKAIYSMMDSQLDIDFYFGDISSESISQMNPKILKGFKHFLKNVYHGNKLVWQKGAVKAALLSGLYDDYILTGNAGIKSNWVIMIIARLLGKRVWLWTHGLRGNESRYSKLTNIIYMRMASGLLFYSERGAALAKKNGISEKKLHVIYNSLDYSTQKLLRGRIGDRGFVRNYFGNDDPYVLYLGRLTATKKVDLIIRALKDIKCNIIIAGDGPERENLENLVSSLSLEDKVWFYGESYDEQMNAQLIYHSDLLISPGNIGLSAIHAMTYGTMAVTHGNLALQMPEVEAVIELSNALGINLLFDNENETSIASIVKDAISYSVSNRDEIRKKCYSIIENKWNADKQMSILKSIFN